MSKNTNVQSLQSLHAFTVTLDGLDVQQKREEIRDYFHKTFTFFESLFLCLKDDSVFYLKSEPTRHPMIFYFGHTATFFINKLTVANVITERVDPEFEAMFAVGVDEMNWDDMDDEHYAWPKVHEVMAYREKVRQLIDELIMTLPLTLPIRQEDPIWIILMGIEHERIHLETSSVLHRQLPIELVENISLFPRCEESGEAPVNEMVAIEGGTVRLGKEKDHNLYGWDNEYGRREVEVDDFKVSKFLVSNGEFMAFVEDGGYTNNEFWDDEGKKFLEIRSASHPVFWVKGDEESYRYRSMLEEINMPLNWPVDVNYLEAKAFCRWKNKKEKKNYRLLSEAEWYRLYERAGIQDVPDFDDSQANINFRHWASSSPVDRFAFGDIFDVMGNVWQWTETPTDAFEGFEVHPAYDDFSTPTFDGKHNLIKGGSWASTGNEITKHARYAFRRHFYQHAGFRYVEGKALQKQEENIYETDELVSQYCDFQYGENYFGVENFAKACAQKAIAYTKDIKQGSALDLGCATGRASFELANVFDKVCGIDFSARFVQVGVELQKNNTVGYYQKGEGDLKKRLEINLEELGFSDVADKVEFWQGDACNLKPHFKNYDLILAMNLIDRLYEPHLFLKSVHERINDGGYLVLTSPYTWLEEYTAKEFWIGGYEDENGNEVTTIEGLKAMLKDHFELVATEDVPFVIRETPRKYQHTLSHMSVWKKK